MADLLGEEKPCYKCGIKTNFAACMACWSEWENQITEPMFVSEMPKAFKQWVDEKNKSNPHESVDWFQEFNRKGF